METACFLIRNARCSKARNEKKGEKKRGTCSSSSAERGRETTRPGERRARARGEGWLACSRASIICVRRRRLGKWARNCFIESRLSFPKKEPAERLRGALLAALYNLPRRVRTRVWRERYLVPDSGRHFAPLSLLDAQ